MNTVLPNDPTSAPHLLMNRLSPSRSGMSGFESPPPNVVESTSFQDADIRPSMIDSLSTANMSNRKRKASEEPSDNERMSTSPAVSPSMSGRPLPSASSHRIIKRTRTNTAVGRPLGLSRLLETLSAEQMRQLLQDICDDRPELQHDIVSKAPRPSIECTLSILHKYENAFRSAFPLGNRPTSDYAYNRVRQHLLQLIEALREYTPHFLPPHETQDELSLTYLDAVTNMIHRLPEWDTFQHRRHKNEAYDEIAKAWSLVIREATKRAGGFHLQFGGWDRKLVEHDQKSGGRLEEAVNALKTALGFMQYGSGGPSVPSVSEERASIRQQLFSGTYGQQQLGVGPGGW